MAHPRIKFENMPNVKPAVVKALYGLGLTRLEHLRGKTVKDLMEIKGIGKESAETLVSELEAMRA